MAFVLLYRSMFPYLPSHRYVLHCLSAAAQPLYYFKLTSPSGSSPATFLVYLNETI
jgi:hypothetical protein